MVVTPHIRTQRVEISAITQSASSRDQSIEGVAARVFGFDPASPDRYPLRWWMLVAITGALSVAAHTVVASWGILAWLAVPVVWVFSSRAFFGWFDRRQRERLLKQFPDALAMIVRSVRVGIPVQEAIRTVARESPQPTSDEFNRLVNDVAVGVTMDDAINTMAGRSGLPEYRFFATALSLQNQTGGALSETLENLADVIRKRAALKAKGHAMASEAKTTAGILAALPLLLGILLWVLSPAYIDLLFTEKTGNNLLLAAAILLATGLLVIRTIIKKSLPA